MEAIVLVGPQGAGKSSWYQANCADTHVRLNLDMLKTRNRENVLLHACLSVGQAFVADNTNVTVAARARYVALARAAGFKVRAVVFEVSMADALARNAQRTGKQRVPDLAVRGTLSKFEEVDVSEGFDEVARVKVVGDG